MKDRYDGSPSKEARVANKRESRLEHEHNSHNEFVKRQQMEVRHKAGKDPRMNGEMMDFCSYMSNNGEHAQEFARELTKGLDKEAFPVK